VRGLNATAEYFLIFSAVLFVVLIPFCVRHARRSKAKIHYLGGLVCGLVSLACISLYFLQVALVFVFFGIAFVIALITFPFIMVANQREADKLRRDTNVTEPLKARDLLNLKGWYKLAFRWGIPKTMSLYILLTFGVLVPLLFALYILGLSVMSASIGGGIAGVIGCFLFYQQLKINHLNPQENPKQASPLAEPPA